MGNCFNTLKKKKRVASFDSPRGTKYLENIPIISPPRKTYQSLKHKFKKLFTSILNSGALRLRMSVKNNLVLAFFVFRLHTT